MNVTLLKGKENEEQRESLENVNICSGSVLRLIMLIPEGESVMTV